MNENKKVKKLLDAIWNESTRSAREALLEGANPSHRVNGYPLIVHAVYTRNVGMVQLLLQYGAQQKSEALGFALENGYGEIVLELLYLGILPSKIEVEQHFGPYPCRQTALFV